MASAKHSGAFAFSGLGMCRAGLLVLALTVPAAGQEPSVSGDETYAERALKEEELQAVEHARRQTAETMKNLEEEATRLAGDRVALNAGLLSAAQRLKSGEIRVRALENRLAALSENESAIRTSLESRRELIAEVLTILQRMGKSLPPAVLSRPDDMLQAVRTSILMDPVLGEMREELDILVNDLEDLAAVRKNVDEEREKLRGELAALGEEQQRLTALVDARQNSLAANRQQMDEERRKAQDLASRAQTLQELIDGMEENVESARVAAAAARRLSESAPSASGSALPFSDPARLAPKTAFRNLRGMLPLPVNGEILHRFGEPDGLGGTTKGITLQTRANSFVVSPADGWVLFAGPYRS
ncbi:MAG: hypothetical protein LBR29_11660, partial [Methylobacteriaceae bacterium]|nr:hypothetical protein [Methylobacteriaceae bacterium]